MTDERNHSVGHIVALARDAAMSASYKPALLKALVRIVRRKPESPIALRDIGAEYLKLYWLQTVVFRLRQAPSLAKEPEVVQRIRGVAAQYGVRALANLPQRARHDLEMQLARVLQINVLRAFHTSAPAAMPPLFEWPGSDSIDIAPATLHFMQTNALALEAVANLWWARYLERVNVLAPLVIDKVMRDGVVRTSLARYLAILRNADGSRCFYCERELDPTIGMHIDHVIPWSFLLDDPFWDLVLACAPCNLSKSDVLPDRHFIEKLASTHVRRAKLALPARVASPLIDREEIDRYYAAAISVEWPAGWNPPN